jgi:hypothetical protein
MNYFGLSDDATEAAIRAGALGCRRLSEDAFKHCQRSRLCCWVVLRCCRRAFD